MIVIIGILCAIGFWQVSLWAADLVLWLFHKPSKAESFRQLMDRMPDTAATLEELLDEVERKAQESGITVTIALNYHERYKPSRN